MANEQDGKLRLDAAKLIQSYPTYRSLPAPMKTYVDSLNAPVIKNNKEVDEWNLAHPTETPKKKQAMNTPCCFQVSWALNAVGGDHTIPPSSPRPRPNAHFGGGYHLGAVDELESYLNGKYGQGETVKTSTRKTRKDMEAYLAGRQGILAFREGWAGAHTEIWDKNRVLQNGAPIGNNTSGVATIDANWMWARPNIYFWEVVPDRPAFILPSWLGGWWVVTDMMDTYYYYFYPDGTVVYRRVAPSFPNCPLPTEANSGTLSAGPASSLRIQWNDEDYAAELYAYPPISSVTRMVGSYENLAALPFRAAKMNF
ncbi:T6SS effector amidase Tae4 family protein [Bosea sp. BK604]|uniref:T6SS effector amidase Tae4 family protein n=1 Tax=Bosea sp. BK604 TaxID=2512180 RepID=UPI00104BEC55|nr:T6SS effector amidase Tae4 family protein [Bosea sp. BK604]TCR59328.1 type VI secretion system (T6SS) effector Tae4 (amidase) [Bosea sp. BK604]